MLRSTASRSGSSSQSRSSSFWSPDGSGAGRADHVHGMREGVVELALGHQGLDETPVVRPFRPDRLAGEDQPGGASPAHQSRKQRRLDDGGKADLDLRHAELRGGVGHPKIARSRDFESRPQAVSGQASHHGYRRSPDRGAHAVNRPDERAGTLPA